MTPAETESAVRCAVRGLRPPPPMDWDDLYQQARLIALKTTIRDTDTTGLFIQKVRFRMIDWLRTVTKSRKGRYKPLHIPTECDIPLAFSTQLDPGPGPLDRAEVGDMAAAILDRLNPEDRDIVCGVSSGDRMASIAKRHGCSEARISNRYRAALDRSRVRVCRPE